MYDRGKKLLLNTSLQGPKSCLKQRGSKRVDLKRWVTTSVRVTNLRYAGRLIQILLLMILWKRDRSVYKNFSLMGVGVLGKQIQESVSQISDWRSLMGNYHC